MWFFFDEYNKVSVAATSFTCISFAVHAKLHAFLHTCRDVNRYGFFAVNPTFPFAAGTLGCYGCSFTIAGRTGGNRLHLAKECIGYFSDLAAAATTTAGLDTAFILRPRSAAG